MNVPAARFGVLVLPLVLLSLRPGSPLADPVPAKPISEVALTAFRLHQIEDSGWNDEEGWTGIVTPAARPLLAAFTRQLRELIGRELNGEAGVGTAEEIQARLVGAMAREGVPMEGDDTDHPYGRV